MLECKTAGYRIIKAQGIQKDANLDVIIKKLTARSLKDETGTLRYPSLSLLRKEPGKNQDRVSLSQYSKTNSLVALS